MRRDPALQDRILLARKGRPAEPGFRRRFLVRWAARRVIEGAIKLNGKEVRFGRDPLEFKPKKPKNN
jgi:hypothetical protein